MHSLISTSCAIAKCPIWTSVLIAFMKAIDSVGSIGTNSPIMYCAASLMSSIATLVSLIIVPYFLQWRRLRPLSGVSFSRRRELGEFPSSSPPDAAAPSLVFPSARLCSAVCEFGSPACGNAAFVVDCPGSSGRSWWRRGRPDACSSPRCGRQRRRRHGRSARDRAMARGVGVAEAEQRGAVAGMTEARKRRASSVRGASRHRARKGHGTSKRDDGAGGSGDVDTEGRHDLGLRRGV